MSKNKLSYKSKIKNLNGEKIMKLNIFQKIRLAFRRAFERKNMAKIVYSKKTQDGELGTYYIDMNFIEDFGDMFNTYSFASSFKDGGVRSFYKSRIKDFKLI